MRINETRFYYIGRGPTPAGKHRRVISIATRLVVDGYDNLVIHMAMSFSPYGVPFIKREGRAAAMERLNDGLYNILPFKGSTLTALKAWFYENRNVLPYAFRNVDFHNGFQYSDGKLED